MHTLHFCIFSTTSNAERSRFVEYGRLFLQPIERSARAISFTRKASTSEWLCIALLIVSIHEPSFYHSRPCSSLLINIYNVAPITPTSPITINKNYSVFLRSLIDMTYPRASTCFYTQSKSWSQLENVPCSVSKGLRMWLIDLFQQN